jgi:hypothetical protein
MGKLWCVRAYQRRGGRPSSGGQEAISGRRRRGGGRWVGSALVEGRAEASAARWTEDGHRHRPEEAAWGDDSRRQPGKDDVGGLDDDGIDGRLRMASGGRASQWPSEDGDWAWEDGGRVRAAAGAGGRTKNWIWQPGHRREHTFWVKSLAIFLWQSSRRKLR